MTSDYRLEVRMDAVQRFDADRIDQILTSWASKGEDERAEAAYLRDCIRQATDDPVLALLTSSLDRQADSMDRLARDVPAAITVLRSDMHALVVRSMLVYGVLSLVLMAGLVGTQIVLSTDGVEVNTTDDAGAMLMLDENNSELVDVAVDRP